MNEGLLVTDATTLKFKYANPAICAMLGYSREELLRLGVADIHPKECLEEIFKSMKAQLRGGKTAGQEFLCLRKDGSALLVDIKGGGAVVIDGHRCAVGSEVSRDPSGYADYEVNESSAVRVRVYSRASAAPVLDGYFGKAAMGDSVYFRPSREATVYLAEGVKSYALRQSAEDLRSKAVLSISVGDLKSLKFAGPNGFSLASSSESWLASGRKLSADQAAELVLSATSLRFMGFAPADTPAGKTGFEKPAADFTAGGAGRTERVIIGREEAGRRYAKAGRGTVGFISKSDADSLLKLLKTR
jgi:PAS domain S-box-containing protein